MLIKLKITWRWKCEVVGISFLPRVCLLVSRSLTWRYRPRYFIYRTSSRRSTFTLWTRCVYEIEWYQTHLRSRLLATQFCHKLSTQRRRVVWKWAYIVRYIYDLLICLSRLAELHGKSCTLLNAFHLPADSPDLCCGRESAHGENTGL